MTAVEQYLYMRKLQHLYQEYSDEMRGNERLQWKTLSNCARKIADSMEKTLVANDDEVVEEKKYQDIYKS
jgi:hypothetical protein